MKQLKILAALAIALGASSSMATTATTTFPVSATVVANCSISSSSGISFGSYTSAQLSVNGTFGVTCTNTTPWTMALNAGTTSGGTISQRLLANGSYTLQYNVYKDSGFTTLFGDGTTGSTITGTGTGSAQSTTVYGKVPSGFYPTPGSYSDTLTLTLTY